MERNNKSKNVKVEIKLTLNQLRILSDMCEFVPRLMMGQVGELARIAIPRPLQPSSEIEKAIKEILFPELSDASYYSIISQQISEMARVLWDMYQVMRHFLAWTDTPEPRDWSMVSYKNPRRIGIEPLIKVGKARAELICRKHKRKTLRSNDDG